MGIFNRAEESEQKRKAFQRNQAEKKNNRKVADTPRYEEPIATYTPRRHRRRIGGRMVESLVGVMVAVIVGVAIAIPVVNDVIATANLTGTTATLINFMPVLVGAGILVSIISVMGLRG